MAKAEAKTAILADGLRYKSKTSGSPFTAGTSMGGSTMSCFRCGNHFPASELETKKYMGKSQKVCKGGCKK